MFDFTSFFFWPRLFRIIWHAVPNLFYFPPIAGPPVIVDARPSSYFVENENNATVDNDTSAGKYVCAPPGIDNDNNFYDEEENDTLWRHPILAVLTESQVFCHK